MTRDNLRNILGDNTNNNLYDSSNVASNANGSIIERIEYLQGLVSAFTSGQVLLKGVVDTVAPSTTNVKCDSLKGYGEDFFNNVFYMQVVRSGGAAPEPEVRKITNYVTATGTFTVDAFSQNVESGDLIYIIHESLVILGRNDADNVYDSSTVAANATGSIIERIHYIQGLLDTEVAAILAAVDTEVAAIKTETDKIAATITKIDAEVVKTTAIQADIGDPSARTNFKSIEAMLGILDAANSSLDDMLRTGFDSSAITNDEDGSVMERLEGLKDRLTTIAGYLDTEVAAILAAVDTEVAAIKTEVDKIETPSDACNRQAGKTQIFTKNITANSDAGVTTVGTITTQSCLIKRIVLISNGATTADLTSAAIKGGASQALELISAATAAKANIDAVDEQVSFSGAAVLNDTDTVIIDLQGGGSTPVDLTVIVEYCACVNGGYIA
ncbi:MAG: hypothetical protein WC346_12380 [Methanogenium sp.]|jgi:hypothetical protein